MKKYLFAIILAASVMCLLFLAGCEENSASIEEIVIDQNTEEQLIPESKPVNNEEILRLKSELQTALQSGGISPETYAEIDSKIGKFESENYEKNLTQELRALLSQLSIGEQENAMPDAGIKQENKTVPEEKTSPTESNIVIWQYRDGKWRPTGVPPACPDPLIFQMPVDIDLPTSILYPGQKRGGDFKPHGGFRIDGTSGPVEVRAPLEGYVVNVAKFSDQFGIHYMFDIQHSCGIMYRLGHLGAVPPKLEAIFDEVPTGEYGDSRTHEVNPVPIALGETIATDTQHGSGFDWGVYDLRKENDAAQNPAFREAHKDEPYQAYHALCWLDYLLEDDKRIIKSLPGADGVSGKTSDYC